MNVKTERLLLVDIETGERLRAVDPAKVSGLKASIAEIGLRTPITVSASRDGDEWNFRLVAGAHRLEALRSLGEEYADCFVMEGDADDAALWEIDENFARSELSDAQRADHHVRREEILKRKGLVSDGPGRPKKNSEKSSSYSQQASETLGVSKRTVEKDLARGKNITPDVMAEVTGTALDKGVVLDELARTPQADQHDKLAEIAARYKAKTPLAADPLNDLEATEKQLAALMSAWNRAGPEAREKFLATVDAPVFDRGQAGR
jgi:ParB-like chromosome segregation protein Spo0J